MSLTDRDMSLNSIAHHKVKCGSFDEFFYTFTSLNRIDIYYEINCHVTNSE